MVRPTVGPVTERLYATLPEVYRDADAAQGAGESGYPLLRYLALLLDQLTALEELRTRLTYVAPDEREDRKPWRRYGDGSYGEGTYGDTDTADLTDPLTADARWLPWLAQLVGVPIDGLTVEAQRAAINTPQQAWARGTPVTIADEARPTLTGGQYVDVRPNYQGNPFLIALVTKAEETPPGYADTVAGLRERPAGYRILNVYLENLPV